jgi:uracil DNA glycosylase
MFDCHPGFSPIKKDLHRLYLEIQKKLSSIPVYSPDDKSCILKTLMLNPYGVRVILLGMDPYPEDATGEAFETADRTLSKNSLRMLASNLAMSLKIDISNITHMSFKNVDGLFAINAAWTCEKTASGKHILMWSEFVAKVINHIITLSKCEILVRFGNEERYKPLIEKLSPMYIVSSYHPAARGNLFLSETNRPFAEAYHVMRYKKIQEIQWWKCFSMRYPIERNIAISESELKVKSNTFHLAMLRDHLFKTPFVNLNDYRCYLGEVPSRDYLKLKSKYDNLVNSLKRFSSKTKHESSTYVLKQSYELLADEEQMSCSYEIENLMVVLIVTTRNVLVRIALKRGLADLIIPLLTKAVLNILPTHTIAYYTFRNQTLAYSLVYELFRGKDISYDYEEIIGMLMNDLVLVMSHNSYVESPYLRPRISESSLSMIPGVSSSLKPIIRRGIRIDRVPITCSVCLYKYSSNEYISPHLMSQTGDLTFPLLASEKDLKKPKIDLPTRFNKNVCRSLASYQSYERRYEHPLDLVKLSLDEMRSNVSLLLRSISEGEFIRGQENKHSFLTSFCVEAGAKFGQIDNLMKQNIFIQNNSVYEHTLRNDEVLDGILSAINLTLQNDRLVSCSE